ncbi:MAG: acetylserotonin O-methyltransferase, partial [Deltaproteobacteria bacterium]|nr:acetylserotonin O-methyltransferase [Deltaproteobacteria bacterium]
GTSPRRRHHGLQDPERTRRFIGAMDHLGRARAHAVVSLLDLTGVRRVLDVGGASGAYAAEFVRQGRNLRATVTDLPEVLPLTRRYLDDGGMADRVDTLPGDYHVDGFGEGWDLVFLSNVIHINSAEENAGLVARSAAALAPGGRLVIQDFVPSEDRSGPPHVVLFSLNMLVNTRAGDTYTLSEIRSWTDAAGLSWLPPVETGVPSTLVIARKP